LNLKLLLPTYRTRFLYVVDALSRIAKGRSAAPVERILNLGTGEGDYDRSIKEFCHELCACDINAEDIEFARDLNRGQPGIVYAVEDGHQLSYPSDYFDIVCCIEVVEHVREPARMVKEISRVLRAGGAGVVTCPSYDFSVVYDPINSALRLAGRRIAAGAYAYGHSKLVKAGDIERWFEEAGLEILERSRLSGPLVALAECYWAGLMQKLLKANSQNATARTRRKFAVKPSPRKPPFLSVTDLMIRADRRLFPEARRSVGLAYVVRKARL
jgi:ubiquinone/menaquinone biosynthesis C-methylase UbiE